MDLRPNLRLEFFFFFYFSDAKSADVCFQECTNEMEPTTAADTRREIYFLEFCLTPSRGRKSGKLNSDRRVQNENEIY